MNKIFKVVWSKVRNAYVVVSEIAKNTVSGVGKRNRVKRFSMGATLAAIALTSSFFLPSEGLAAGAEVADYSQYIAIRHDAPNNKGMEVWKDSLKNNTDGKALIEVDQYTYKYYDYYIGEGNANNSEAIIYKKVTISNKTYYVRDGYTISVDDIGVAKISGNPAQGSTLATLQHKAYAIRDVNDNVVRTVTGKTLNNVHLATYGAATNAGGVRAIITWDYMLNWDGDDTAEDHVVNKVSKDSKFSTEIKEVSLGSDGNYYYRNRENENVLVGINDVYFLSTQTTAGYTTSSYVFVNGNDEIYNRVIKGSNGEVLLTGVDSQGNYYTYWGAEADDHNTLLKDSGMTVHQLHETFDALQQNDLSLLQADIKGIKSVIGENGTKELHFVTQDGTVLNSNALVISSVEDDVNHRDTVITFTGGEAGSGTLEVNAGSRVSIAKDGNSKTTITVNGQAYDIVDTNIDTHIKVQENGYAVTNNEVVLDMVQNGTAIQDKVKITGVASKQELDTLAGKVTTNITNIQTNTTNISGILGGDKFNLSTYKDNNNNSFIILQNSENEKIGEVKVSVTPASGGIVTDGGSGKDTTITFGEGNNAFTFTTGSIVSGTLGSNNTLTQIKINGEVYNLFNSSNEVHHISVTGGGTGLERHGWTLTDITVKGEGNQIVSFKDTTLIANENTTANNGTYTIEDTAGNRVILQDIASASQVLTNTNAITEINNTLISGAVKIGIDKTDGKNNIALSVGNAVKSTVSVSETTSNGDTAIKFSDGTNDFVVNTGSKVESIYNEVTNGDNTTKKVLTGLKVNGTEYEVFDTKLSGVVENATTGNAGEKVKSYTISATSGPSVVLNNVASIDNDIKNILIDSGNKTISLQRNDNSFVNGGLTITSTGGGVNGAGDVVVKIANGTGENEKSISLTTGSIVSASTVTVDNVSTNILDGIYINGTKYNLPSHQTDAEAFDDFALSRNGDAGYTVNSNGEVELTVLDRSADGSESYKVYIKDVARASDLKELSDIVGNGNIATNSNTTVVADDITDHINNLYSHVNNDSDWRLVKAPVTSGNNTEYIGNYGVDDNKITLKVQNSKTKAVENIVVENVADARDIGKITDVNINGTALETGVTNSNIVGHINDLYSKVNTANSRVDQYSTVNNTDGNLSISSTTTDGLTAYEVNLGNAIIVGSSNKAVSINGVDGSISLGRIHIKNEYDSSGANIKSEITGLSNTEWNVEGVYNEGRAATEEQLSSALGTVNEAIARSNLFVSQKFENIETSIQNIEDNVNVSKTKVVAAKGKNNVFSVTDITSKIDKHNTYEIDVADMHVSGVQVTDGSSGALNGIVIMNDTTTADIKGLHDYYATGLNVVTDANDGSKNLVLSLNNGEKVSMNLSDITAGLGTMSSWKAKANGSEIVVKNGETLEFAKGNDNIVVDAVNGKITVATAENVSFTTVNVGDNVNIDQDGIVIENGTSDIVLTKTNVSVGNNRILNVVAGEADTDAVNVKQLKDARTQVVNGKNTTARESLNSDTNQYTYSIDLNDNIILGNDTSKQINIDGTSGKVKVGNVVEVSTTGINVGDGVKIGTSSVNVGNKVNVSADGIAMGGTQITGLAAGTADTDAVNFGQLKSISATVNKGWNLNVVTDTNTNTYNVVPDGSVTLQSANNNLQITNNNGVVTFTAKDDFISTASFNANNGTLTLGYNDNSKTALSVAGLMSGWTAQVGTETLTVDNKKVIEYVAGDNIVLDIDGNDIKVATESTVTFDSMTVNGATGTNDIVINSAGISAGNKTITNVAAGVNATDAVNVSQLNSVESKLTANDKHIVAGNYTVEKDTVTLKVQQGVGTADVVIDNVASASNLAAVKGHTINKIAMTGGNGIGAINLIRENNSIVPGGLTFASGGGTEATGDTYVHISGKGNNGSVQDIILHTGTKVEANSKTADDSTMTQLTLLTVNGKDYFIPEMDVDQNGNAVFQDYHVTNGNNTLYTYKDSDNKTVVVKGYSVDDENGVVELHVHDRHQNTGSHEGVVRIGNLASKAIQEQLQADSIENISITSITNGGTIGLNRVGTSDITNGTTEPVDGTITVTAIKGSSSTGDAQLQFSNTIDGTGKSFAVNVGSTVRANSDVTNSSTTYLDKLSVNGTSYKVFTPSDIKASFVAGVNNLKVDDATHTDANGAKHGWRITDSNPSDGSQSSVVYRDTTLVSGNALKQTNSDGVNTYEVKDTAGNIVTINDVASASAVSQRFDNIEGNITNIQGDISNLTTDVSNIRGDISNLTTDVSNIRGDISNLTTDVTNIRTDVNNLTTDVTNIRTDISNLTTDVSNIRTDISNLTTDVTNIRTDVNNLTTDVTNIRTDISNLTTDVSNIRTDITNITGNQITSGSIAAYQYDAQTGGSSTITLVTESNSVDDISITGLRDTTLVANGNNEGVVDADNTFGKTYTISDTNKNSVVLKDVASASKVSDLAGTVGAATKESLKESYKNTTYLQATKAEDGKEVATESLVEADVKLDKAIKDNADLSIKNDLALQSMINNNAQYLDSRINQLGSKVNKVGAGAAALAALHPMDFDPDDKLSFAVGAGNYAGETATALGAFYRPNEKVMMNVAGTYGNGENMVNMGVSFALDRTNHVSNSRTAMAKEIVDLREQVATQGQQIAQLVALVQQLAGVQQPVVPAEQLFPDVSENHWAYEYINGLAAKGIIDGYPDGNFGGDRTMTRYEFAAMLFRAMEQGVVLSEQIRQEFEKELGRVRVDRVKGADNDPNKIERVRVNKAADRDNYGSKIVQVKH